MKWLACELHTHTLHSDGNQTLRELAAGAVKLGFEVIALTDHNTMSGLVGKKEVEDEYGLTIIPGMEWTTFYGHMLTIGSSVFADWRQADPGRHGHGIEAGIAEVHRLGGLAGLAHPFRIGSPACTGCFWEYEVQDWSAVDYVEVWSGTSPSIQTNNRRAYELWTDKLDEGFRIAATSGRDWHEQKDTNEPIPVTYLGVEEADFTESEESGLIEALRKGRVSVTTGPLLNLTLAARGKRYPIGATVPCAGTLEAGAGATFFSAELSVDFKVRKGIWTLPEPACRWKLLSNLGEEHSMDFACSPVGSGEQERFEFEARLPASVIGRLRKWLRAELWGTVRGAHMRLAFTNAIYFQPEGVRLGER